MLQPSSPRCDSNLKHHSLGGMTRSLGFPDVPPTSALRQRLTIGTPTSGIPAKLLSYHSVLSRTRLEQSPPPVRQRAPRRCEAWAKAAPSPALPARANYDALALRSVLEGLGSLWLPQGSAANIWRNTLDGFNLNPLEAIPFRAGLQSLAAPLPLHETILRELSQARQSRHRSPQSWERREISARDGSRQHGCRHS